MTLRADGATTLAVGGHQDRRGHDARARARARNELDTLLARERESVFEYVGCIAPLSPCRAPSAGPACGRRSRTCCAARWTTASSRSPSAAALGGSIAVTSTTGLGTTFRLHLPRTMLTGGSLAPADASHAA